VSNLGGTYTIDAQNSVIRWWGSKPTGVHNGTVPVSSGSVTVDNGNITGGTIEIDMNNITVLDLEGENKMKLEAHLKGKDPGKENDFFNVDKYPKATYVVNSASPLENDPDGTHMINGTLTIKDISKPVNFKANVTITNDKLSAETPEFSIDRTEYDIRFKSRKFFNNLQDDFVDDEFKLKISLNAVKEK
jgi:polyisoprenoid-binding protein YceI